MIPVSDSEEELIVCKPKSSKVFHSDDDSSDNDKKSGESSGFVDRSGSSLESSESLSFKSRSYHERRTNLMKKVESEDISVKSKQFCSSEDEDQFGSRKSSSSSDQSRSKSPLEKSNNKSHQSRKSSSSNDQNKSRSSKKSNRLDTNSHRSSKSDSLDEKKRSQSRKSDSSDNESCSSSRKLDTSDDKITPRSQVKKSLQRSQCKKLDSSDDEDISVDNRMSKIQDNDEEECNTSTKPTTDSNKSGGKFSLITESDLESENDEKSLVNESASDDELSSQINKKANIRKKSKLKNGAASDLADSSESDDEEKSSPKRVQKSIAKRKSEPKPAKGSKCSKKEKDPLLSIRSETQRMIREGRISLPYHQPKQRSLHEFLQRRRAASFIPLKATPEVLKTVCEQLTIKQKEVEDFYKSESDHSDAETQSNNIPETNTINEIDDTAKEVEPTTIDSIAENNDPSVETEHENELNSTLVSNNKNLHPIVSEQEKNANSAEVTELVNSDESNKNYENPPLKEPVEISVSEKKTFKHLIANKSNGQNYSKLDLIIPTDINTVTESLKPNECVKSNECDDEQDIPDSENFVLTIEDSCPIDTDELMKPSNESASKISGSEDFVLSLEDSSFKDTETHAQKEPEPNSTDINKFISKPIITKDHMKSRIETLLSTRNIKLSEIKFNSAPQSIQFEIPTFRQVPTGIHLLKEKFIKHSLAKNKPKSAPTQLNVITTQTDTDGEVTGVTKETLTLGLGDNENVFSDPKFKTPGTKHVYLKKKMLDILISKKEATWNEYQNEKRRYYGSDPESENDIDEEDDSTTCKKLNFKPYHPEDEPDDDELIEDDVVYEEKTRAKNCYLDEEAEVSEDTDDEDENIVMQEDEYENPAVEEDDDDDVQSVDSDGLDFIIKDDSPLKPAKSSDTTEMKKLFKYDTTGSDLENKLLGLESISQCNSSENISTSQILDLCSGQFFTQDPGKFNTAVTYNVDDEFFVADSQNNEDSQNICLSFPDPDDSIENPTETSKKELTSRLKDIDNEDEEEMIIRKKPTMRILEDSDDEITEPNNDANEEDTSDLEIVVNNDQDEENVESEADEENVERDDIEAEEFGYNSEEELVTYDKTAARGFFENEAELSGSEWGSEDENERDLDTLEKEAGDDDEIDVDALKDELGKIHMRQLLDDDQRDVRLLKEMLLEDGELHSDAKRQRKFQWKNLTDGDDFFKNYSYDSDDENNLNDDENDESEEHWRKIRHERETFLSQQEQKKSILSETMAETVESSIIQLTASTKMMKKNIITKNIQRASSNLTSKNEPKQNLPKMNPKFNCGSFLSRGKLLLSKMSLAVSDTKGSINGVKNSKNFVFGARSPEKKQVSVLLDKPAKRKFTSSSPSITKRKKLIVENVTPGATSILARLALSEEL